MPDHKTARIGVRMPTNKPIRRKSFVWQRPVAKTIAFGGVVVVTIVAAESFDPRLIWDQAGNMEDMEAMDETVQAEGKTEMTDD